MHIPKQSVLLLIAVVLAAFMDGLDGSIINIALPEIAKAFGSDAGSVSWTVIVYLLMVAGTILIFGNIASRGHVKKILVVGFAIFTAASALCGFSQTLEILIAARLVQGLGASMIVACAPIICVKFMPAGILGLSFGVLTAATSAGFAAGPAIGGVLMHYLSWNWIFFINIPIGVFAVLYCLKVIPKEDATKPERFDMLGAVLLFAAMSSAAYVLESSAHVGLFDARILFFAFVCVASFAFFCVHELKTSRPLINIRVFRSFAVNAVIASFFIIQIVYCGFLYLLPFYLTNAVKADFLESGMLLLVPPLITALASVPLSRWSDRTGRRWFMAGSAFMLVLTGCVFAFIMPEYGMFPLICCLVLMGFSIAAVSGSGPGKIVEVMPEGERELGSTVMMTCVYFGAVVGTALYACVFTVLTSGGGVVLSFAELSTELFMHGFKLTMAAGVVLSVAAVVFALVVKDRKI